MAESGKRQFGKLLQTAREAIPMSREELAQKVGVDQSYIWRLEERSQRRPSPETTIALADALGVPDDELNNWLLAAGHEPIPFVSSVRSNIRISGIARRGPNAQGTSPIATDTGIRAKRLQQLGLTNDVLDRLLTALSGAPLPLQAQMTDAVSRSLDAVIGCLQCPVETAVIPAAGGQHRLFAANILQRLLVSVIREASEAGIGKIVLVVAPGNAEILLDSIQRALSISIVPSLSIEFVEQPAPSGLGDAVLRSRPVVGSKPFAVLLPDDIVEPKQRKIPRLSRLTKLMSETKGASFVAVAPVSKSGMLRCGVVESAEIHPPKSHGYSRILQFVEKPDRAHPICDLPNVFGIVGRYVLQASVFSALDEIKKTGRTPLELTEGLENLRRRGEAIYGVDFIGTRADIGEMFARASDITI